MTIKAGIIGINTSKGTGKMGMSVLENVKNFPDIEITKTISREDNLQDHVEGADVWIDFSSIGKALEHSQVCANHSKPIIVCTTGDNKEFLAKGPEIKNIPILYSPNISLTWFILQHAAKQLGKSETDYQVWDALIIDNHFHTKKDKPSGASRLISNFFANHEFKSFRTKIVGAKIEIILTNEDEEVVLSYTTFNRNPYSKGALHAAKWILNQAPGFYQTQDLYQEYT